MYVLLPVKVQIHYDENGGRRVRTIVVLFFSSRFSFILFFFVTFLPFLRHATESDDKSSRGYSRRGGRSRPRTTTAACARRLVRVAKRRDAWRIAKIRPRNYQTGLYADNWTSGDFSAIGRQRTRDAIFHRLKKKKHTSQVIHRHDRQTQYSFRAICLSFDYAFVRCTPAPSSRPYFFFQFHKTRLRRSKTYRLSYRV